MERKLTQAKVTRPRPSVLPRLRMVAEIVTGTKNRTAKGLASPPVRYNIPES